jgi:hypothetical protein
MKITLREPGVAGAYELVERRWSRLSRRGVRRASRTSRGERGRPPRRPAGVDVPTFERLARFDREFRRLARELQRAFLEMPPRAEPAVADLHTRPLPATPVADRSVLVDAEPGTTTEPGRLPRGSDGAGQSASPRASGRGDPAPRSSPWVPAGLGAPACRSHRSTAPGVKRALKPRHGSRASAKICASD